MNLRGTTSVFIIEREILFRELIEMYLALNDLLIAGRSEEYKQQTRNRLSDLKPAVTICGSDIFPLNQEVVKTMITEINQLSTSLIIVKGRHQDEVNGFISASAKGIILRSDGCADLLDCLKTVKSGRRFLSAAVKDMHRNYLMGSHLFAKNTYTKELTKREKEIVRLILEFNSNEEIGRKLSISYQTVKNHKYHIMKKLGLRGRGELLKYLVKLKKELDIER